MFFYFVFFFKSSAPGPWKPDAAAHGTLLFLFFFFFFFSSSSFSSFSSSCSLIWRTCYLFVWFFFSTFGLVISATHFRRLAARTAGPRSSFVFDIFRGFFLFVFFFCLIFVQFRPVASLAGRSADGGGGKGLVCHLFRWFFFPILLSSCCSFVTVGRLR